jgi:DNA-directed RNA polymerase subunit RPC12/RpoP
MASGTGAVVKLACPICGSWTVPVGGKVTLAELGRHAEFVSGRCERCGSRVLCEPDHRRDRDRAGPAGGAGGSRP